MVQNKETPRKPGRPPRAGAAAEHMLRVRLTPDEAARLAASAAARGRPVADHVRAWIAGEDAPPSPPAPPPPVEPPYVTAKPRPGVEPRLMSRWTPRYVWTLHMVPGRLDGPPLVVHRRVLGDRDEVGHDIETPGGDMGVDFDELQEKGRARSYGSDRFPGTSAALRGEVAPPIAGWWWGRDLAIDVYDHNPTEQERAEWVARRKVEQAALRDLPCWVWVTREGRRAGSLDIAARCPVDPEIGGMRRYDMGIRFGERKITIDLMELVHAGRIDDGHTAPHVVYLHKPTAEQLRADGAERARKAAEETRHRAEAEAFANAFRNAPATANGAPPPPPKPLPPTGPGPDAVRFFGLDPATATWPDVRRVWNERALDGHSDHGGKADLGELTRQKDAARAYIEARDAARAAPTGTR